MNSMAPAQNGYMGHWSIKEDPSPRSYNCSHLILTMVAKICTGEKIAPSKSAGETEQLRVKD